MASLKLISTLVCFVMNYFPHNGFAEITEKMYGNQDLKLAIQNIEELQRIVRAQDFRISTLEKGHSVSKEHAVTELQMLVKKQNNRIAQLETRIKELENVIKAEENAPIETKGYTLFSNIKEMSANSTENFTRKGIFKLNDYV